MNQEVQSALMAADWALPPAARAMALVFLVAFAIFTAAVVPLEYRFFQRVDRRALPWMLALDLFVFLLIVLALLGFILEWFSDVRGLLMGAMLFIGLWVLVPIYLVLRIILAYRVYLGQREVPRMSREVLERLLANMRREEARKSPGEDDDSPGTPTGDEPETAPGESPPSEEDNS